MQTYKQTRAHTYTNTEHTHILDIEGRKTKNQTQNYAIPVWSNNQTCEPANKITSHPKQQTSHSLMAMVRPPFISSVYTKFSYHQVNQHWSALPVNKVFLIFPPLVRPA